MTGERPAKHQAWPWFAGLTFLLLLDQSTKMLVRAKLALHESIPLLGDEFLRLTHVQNPGIAFGLTFLNPTILMVFGWTASILLAVYLFRLARLGDPLRWPVMLFLAGAVGNSIDRTLFGKVTDFVDSDFPDFIMSRWPVFNVADSCVTVGITIMIILTLFQHNSKHSTASLPYDRSSECPDTLSNPDAGGTASAAD
jgi:signal peptidase II